MKEFFVVFCLSIVIKAPSPLPYQARAATGVGSGPQFVTPVLEPPDLPQVLMDMEVSSKIEHRVVFRSLELAPDKGSRLFWLLAESGLF